jgi:hypothetical protein
MIISSKTPSHEATSVNVLGAHAGRTVVSPSSSQILREDDGMIVLTHSQKSIHILRHRHDTHLINSASLLSVCQASLRRRTLCRL